MRDALVLSAIAASPKKRVQIGTAVVNIFTRSLGQLAITSTTINDMSGGRFTLGLRTSTAAIIEGWHGQQFQEPMKRLGETVALLRNYFSGDRFSHQGAFFTPQNARFRRVSAPKIALAALNDRMITTAATLADRVILNLYPLGRVRHAKDLIDSACDSAGKREHPNLSVVLYFYVLGDDEKGFEAAKDLLTFYSGAAPYNALFSKIGFSAEAKSMRDAWEVKNREATRSGVSRRMAEELIVTGGIQTLRERVGAYTDAGVDEVFVAQMPFGDYRANVDKILNDY